MADLPMKSSQASPPTDIGSPKVPHRGLDEVSLETQHKELDQHLMEYFGDYVDDPPHSRIAEILRSLAWDPFLQKDYI
jgi:hypothetical protein